MSKKAIILFSGGLDSTTCLAIAKDQGFEPCLFSVFYGQKHQAELNAAKRIAKHFEVKIHKILEFPEGFFSCSALIDPDWPVPDATGSKDIPPTYVPARNTIFLSHALGFAEMIGSSDLFYGASCVDYSGYPDCRPEYIKAFEKMANLATKSAVEGTPVFIHTPLMHLSKAETIKKGLALCVDYSMTVSCYRADVQGRACGTCDSCAFRKKGFLEAGVEDVTRYVN